jgi:hypothetical protein
LDRPRAGGIVQATNVKGAPGGTIRKVGSHVVRPAAARARGRIINGRQCEDWAGITASPDFLAGGGEMGALMRAKLWSGTPLGPPETWPGALKMVVRICLNSRFPISLWRALSWSCPTTTSGGDTWENKTSEVGAIS